VSGAGWGIGFFLFLLIAALLYNRLVFHPLPAAPLAPSLWIGLGPVAVAGLALIRVAQDGAKVWGEMSVSISAFAQLGAFAFWGFGLWWLAAAVLLLARYLRAGSLPFGVGWWAFTFPVGAYTVMTLTLARAWRVSALEVFGIALFVLLVVFWLVVTIRTLIGVRTGEAWKR
jgi:tellurite resistance protein TehA-like permease